MSLLTILRRAGPVAPINPASLKIGVGLQGLAHYSPERVLVNAVQQGYPYIGFAGVTLTIASPCVVTAPAAVTHITAGMPVVLSGGTLPTGLVSNTAYYVVGSSIAGQNFQISATLNGPPINTTGSQSGVHTLGVTPQAQGDANGWPTQDFSYTPHWVYKTSAETPGAEVAHCTIGCWVDLPTVTLSAGVTVSNFVQGASQSTFDLNFPSGQNFVNGNFVLNFTNTRATGGAGGTPNTGCPGGFFIAHPGYTIADITNKVITDEIKGYTQQYGGVLRMKDYQQTDFVDAFGRRDGYDPVNWADVRRRATYRFAQLTYEDMVDVANKCNRDSWWCVRENMTDACITAMVTFLEASIAPGLAIYLEFSNETWNQLYWQYFRCIALAYNEMKGLLGGQVGCSIATLDRTSNVVTLTSDINLATQYGFAAGRAVSFWNFDGTASVQSFTLASVSGNTATFPSTGADGPIPIGTIYPGQFATPTGYSTDAAGYASGATSIGVAGTHGIARGTKVVFAGQATVYKIVNDLPGPTGNITITPALVAAIPAAVTAMTFTFGLQPRCSSNPSSTIAYGGVIDPQQLTTRFRTRRLAQISNLVRAVVGDAKIGVGKRWRITWADQMGTNINFPLLGNSGAVELATVEAMFPANPLSYYVHALAGAPYFLNKTTRGNVASTLDDIMADGLSHAQSAVIEYAFEPRAITCAKYGIENTCYEGPAPDFNDGISFVTNAAQAQLRLTAQLDPRMQAQMTGILGAAGQLGYGAMATFTNGILDANVAAYLGIWSVSDSISHYPPSNRAQPKLNAIADIQASGVPLSRNLLGPGIGTQTDVTYNTSQNLYGAPGWVVPANQPAATPWIITVPSSGVWALVITYACSTAQTLSVAVNGVAVGSQVLLADAGNSPLFLTADHLSTATFLCPFEQSVVRPVNALELIVPSSGSAYAVFKNLRFTRIS